MRRAGDTEQPGGDGFHRGRKCETEGDLKTAQRWYREAAEAGHRAAAIALGGLLASESIASEDELVDDEWRDKTRELKRAKKWWQRGVRGLDASSAQELGQLLDWDPELVETEHRLRVAYEAGDTMAGYWLARLLEERSSLDDRKWRKEAADLFDTVSEQTRHAAVAIHRRFGSWWYPGWRLRQLLSSGRVPWGIDAHTLRTHCYALARRQRLHSAERPLRNGYLTRLLEREHEGETEAAFLLGVLELAGKVDEAESWLRLAAGAGHRQAAFELGVIRADEDDDQGAVHWFRRAAEEGHPGGAYELARALRTTDRSAAATECRKAAKAGHLRAAALLRILESSPRAADPVRDGSRDSRITELLASWDELSGLAPEPDHCVDYLAERSGLPRADVAKLRRVRNQCAHPADRGWPTSYEIDIALTTAKALQRRIQSPHDSQHRPDAR